MEELDHAATDDSPSMRTDDETNKYNLSPVLRETKRAIKYNLMLL